MDKTNSSSAENQRFSTSGLSEPPFTLEEVLEEDFLTQTNRKCVSSNHVAILANTNLILYLHDASKAVRQARAIEVLRRIGMDSKILKSTFRL